MEKKELDERFNQFYECMAGSDQDDENSNEEEEEEEVDKTHLERIAGDYIEEKERLLYEVCPLTQPFICYLRDRMIFPKNSHCDHINVKRKIEMRRLVKLKSSFDRNDQNGTANLSHRRILTSTTIQPSFERPQSENRTRKRCQKPQTTVM